MLKPDNFNTLPKFIVYLFFIIGVISAICFRVLIVFQYYYKSLTRLIWYIGIIGYFFFFLYRFIISRKRKNVILDNKLLEKLENKEELSEHDRSALFYVLKSIDKSKENYNYYIIFILSILAVLFDITAWYFSG